MYLKSIHLLNFKNYTDAHFQFTERINCLVGLNGVGKTNLLDAIYYLSMCKSYFNHSDQLNINHQADFFAIHGSFEFIDIEGETKVSCIQKSNSRKIFKFNQKEYTRLSDHIGILPSVMISPYDSDYINGSSESRRKYFDSVIAQYDKIYLDTLIQYNKVLLQRNVLLKQFCEKGCYDQDAIDIWNDKLLDYGTSIYQTRCKFIENFYPVFKKYFSDLSPQTENVSIEYESKLHSGAFADLLADAKQKDMALQYTSVGIHKDDYLFFMNGYPVKKFCSQGQQKTLLIALKLAHFEYLKIIKKVNPLLLLDDVFDKLDDTRVAYLTSMVANEHFGQVFISHTQKNRMEELFHPKGISYCLHEL
ncbi:MAG: DNA replication and repair protein RecF [Bacteroidales bacterium]|jgi:DNA replication and repair protein RecF|nr:DNA replication and repair protein RecF [Bacteroidales bacterium]MDD3330244.1 DNA replication and repair protein RecF [Bacteroidales bacterium]MDD3691003.1 DNA replication and repair protein RecF [Bacteroidales bacterium]MDD4044266.1 DNA replication and repair protein RecF [Bacteroidales bacterium]MDD4581499.1 DNA replication and repair protein RecF [Bacteroidales bacterium]